MIEVVSVAAKRSQGALVSTPSNNQYAPPRSEVADPALVGSRADEEEKPSVLTGGGASRPSDPTRRPLARRDAL